MKKHKQSDQTNLTAQNLGKSDTFHPHPPQKKKPFYFFETMFMSV